MNAEPITEADLHAYVDGRLESARRAAVERYLDANPAERQRLADYRAINAELHRLFDPALDEPIPARLILPPKRRQASIWLGRAAAAVGFMLLGGVAGWLAHEQIQPAFMADRAFVRQALAAHAIYVPEVRHPVEVEASQQQHLGAWLSKRLGMTLPVPTLETLGFQLLGGRLLPATDGKPAAQFMYQDTGGRRLTLYVRRGLGDNHETAFRFAEQDGIRAFYWVDDDLACALIGDVERPLLDQAAHTVYQQLNL